MNKIIDYIKDDYYITTDNRKVQVDQVCSLLAKTYWANSRSRETVIKSIENSLCFSLFHNDKQIGLVRVVTDYSTFAYLCDVIISDEYRNKGLGNWMLDCVMQYPDLQNLRRWSLVTKDAHNFYKKFGFVSLEDPDIYMEITNKSF